MRDNERRIAREKKIVSKMIDALTAAGWLPFETNNGEQVIVTRTKQRVLAHVFSVDLSYVRFVKVENGKTLSHKVMLVCGNDDCIISDYSYPVSHEKELTTLHDAISDYADSL